MNADRIVSIAVLLSILAAVSWFAFDTNREANKLEYPARCIAIENKNRMAGVTYEEREFYEKHCALHELTAR